MNDPAVIFCVLGGISCGVFIGNMLGILGGAFLINVPITMFGILGFVLIGLCMGNVLIIGGCVIGKIFGNFSFWFYVVMILFIYLLLCVGLLFVLLIYTRTSLFCSSLTCTSMFCTLLFNFVLMLEHFENDYLYEADQFENFSTTS